MSLSGHDPNMLQFHTPASAMSVSSYELSGNDPERTYKIVFAGDAAVGKTCFIHRFCKGTFATKLGSTLGVFLDFINFKYLDTWFILNRDS